MPKRLTKQKNSQRLQAITKRSPRKPAKKPIERYEHPDKKRVNNPPVGLVTPETDVEEGKKTYRYDPHIDPALQFDSGKGTGHAAEIERIIENGLAAKSMEEVRAALAELKRRRSPYLNWAGKAERTTFQISTVSLHVHERIDPKTIIEAVKTKNGKQEPQLGLFEQPNENPPLREAIDFYKHEHNWSNRLVAGDSLLVMNSLLEKEGMAGKVQMAYLDPPYGVEYKSNFQPFTNQPEVKDRKDEDLTQEPETLKAFRDTWELGLHSYLTYLRDRLWLIKDLLNETGCCFVQINSENCHLVVNLMSEVFGSNNFVANIVFRKKSIPLGSKYLETMHDHLVLFARNKEQMKYHHLYEASDISAISSHGPYAVYPDGKWQKIDPTEFQSPKHPSGTHYYRLFSLLAPSYSESTDFEYEFEGGIYPPPSGGCWVCSKDKLDILKRLGRLQPEGNSLSYRLYYEDFPFKKMTATWNNVGVSYTKIYAVQTSPAVLQRCILMTTDPGDLVFDPTCGSGTTAVVAEQWGRRWITCDTSRVAMTLAKQRLVTALFDYYTLAHPDQGVSSGFLYKTVPHITGKSITDNPEIRAGMNNEQINAAILKYAKPETLFDQPKRDASKARVTGPFTVEAVPSPVVKPISEVETEPAADAAVARQGETLRQAEWREELFRTGVRGKGGQIIRFARVEPLPGSVYLHVDAEVKAEASGGSLSGKRVVVSFGPEHALLEQKQVEFAWKEARMLEPRPSILLFAAFDFDPEASKDIDEMKPEKAGMTFLKAKMNGDLFTEDLKKKRASNESFWLIGQPDIEVRQIRKGENAGKFLVEVRGFDYFNTKTGQIESGDNKKIAMWMLDTDYDGRSIYSRQVFFPMAGPKDGWSKLAANLKAEIDEEKIKAYRGTVSLPFEKGKRGRIAVKIVDDRGIESLVIREVK